MFGDCQRHLTKLTDKILSWSSLYVSVVLFNQGLIVYPNLGATFLVLVPFSQLHGMF